MRVCEDVIELSISGSNVVLFKVLLNVILTQFTFLWKQYLKFNDMFQAGMQGFLN